MTIDLHVHALLSKSFAFDPLAVDRLQVEAKRLGLSGFALTEHIHAPDFWKAHDLMSRRYSYADGVYRGGAVPMLSGLELTVRNAGDVILIGTLEALRALDDSFRPRLSDGYHPELREALDALERRPITKIAAHPYRPGKYLAGCDRRQLARFDAVEMNGKDSFLLPATRMKARQLALRLGLPLVGSSDAHFWPQLGVSCTSLPAGEITLPHVREALTTQRTAVRLRPHGAPIVRSCRSYKTLVKAQREVASARRVVEAVA